jgi:hypothetical protein
LAEKIRAVRTKAKMASIIEWEGGLKDNGNGGSETLNKDGLLLLPFEQRAVTYWHCLLAVAVSYLTHRDLKQPSTIMLDVDPPTRPSCVSEQAPGAYSERNENYSGFYVRA